MIKHLGKHNSQKVVILYRKVPNEDHMALVIYPDLISKIVQAAILTCLESPSGQEAKEFADALFLWKMDDGTNCLETCHRNGFIKKIQTSQVIVTPTASSTIRLDELNKILDEMAQGEDAVKRLAELDNNRGMATKTRNVEKTTSASVTGEPVPPSVAGVLSDSDIAKTQLVQAERMKREATSLLNEAARLEQEARTLDPTLNQDAAEEKIAA